MLLFLLLFIFCAPVQAMQMHKIDFGNVCPSSHTRILDMFQASIPHYKNIDGDIIALLDQYRSDDHLIAALLPMAQLPLIAGRVDVRKLDEKRSLDDISLAREIDRMLQVINGVLGNYWTRSIARQLVIDYLKKGL